MTDHVDSAEMNSPWRPSVGRLIERSSLGGHGARQLRARTSTDLVRRTLLRTGPGTDAGRGVRRRRPTDAVVLGAGVTGLTTAIRLAEAGLAVRVLAAQPPLDTFSVVAAASWGPGIGRSEREMGWSEVSRLELEEIARVPGSGVRLITGMEATGSAIGPPSWAARLPDFRVCTAADLPPGYASGWKYTVPMAYMPTYLDYLRQRLEATGTSVEVRTARDLADVTGLAPVTVNCTGLGARALVPDPGITPVRGQLVVVENPGVDWFFEDLGDGPDLTYFVPHVDCVILGGTAIPGSDDHDDPDATDAIIDRCARIEPLLRNARVLKTWTGQRPYRSHVRLEREERDGLSVIHNYGHGGAGVTFSWGCAAEVLRLMVSPRRCRR